MADNPDSEDLEGIWRQVLLRDDRPSDWTAGRPALFLDRDGVIVEDVHYLSDPHEARLIEGAAQTIARANERDIPVVIVTNQAGIAYGYYGWDAFERVQAKILTDLADRHARIDAVIACPFHEKGQPPYQHPDHPARKPNPGMILAAAEMMGLDLARSWMVGDKAVDVEAALKAGLAGAVHVFTGHGGDAGQREKAEALAGGAFKVQTAPSLAEAADLIPLLGDRD